VSGRCGEAVAVAGREGAGGRGTDGMVGGPEGASRRRPPARRRRAPHGAGRALTLVRIEAQGVLKPQQDG
jgi:hypothetical protein